MQDAQKQAVYETGPVPETAGELQRPQWSVVSFERCEAASLTFVQAVQKITELDAAHIAGLCIVTDEAAARIHSGNA